MDPEDDGYVAVLRVVIAAPNAAKATEIMEAAFDAATEAHDSITGGAARLECGA